MSIVERLTPRTTVESPRLRSRLAVQAASLVLASSYALFGCSSSGGSEDLSFHQTTAYLMTPATGSDDTRAAAFKAPVLEEVQSHILHSFTTTLGDEIDCIERERQPGLRIAPGEYRPIASPPPSHPPSYAVAGANSLFTADPSFDGQGNVRHCPDGTVPFRRASTALTGTFFTGSVQLPYVVPAVATHDHIVAKQTDTSINGAGSTMSFINPTVSSDSDMSLSQIWVFDGNKYGSSLNANVCPASSVCTLGVDCFQTLEVGIQVQQQLWGDATPHLFVFDTVDGYDTSCYSQTFACSQTQRDRWVEVDQYAYPGMPLPYAPVTEPEMEPSWYYSGGNWWLDIDNHWAGYYPADMFAVSFGTATSMSQGVATGFEAGGEVAQLAGESVQMGMGTQGYNCFAGANRSTYHRRLMLLGSGAGFWVDMAPQQFLNTDFTSYSYGNMSECQPGNDYIPSNQPFLGNPATWDDWGYYFYFGGQGAPSESPTTCL